MNPGMHSYQVAIGFDFGTSKIGVAVGQSITSTATPINQIPAKKGVPDWPSLDKILKEWQPDVLVVGIPTKMDGSWQLITELCNKFINDLKSKYEIPVYGVDERLSTKSAKEEIFSKSGYKGLQKISVDSVAASIILEQWMNNN